MTGQQDDSPPVAILHPALAAEAERLEYRVRGWLLGVRQKYMRLMALALGAWEAYDGALFLTDHPDRLQSPVFKYAAHVVPGWPWAAGLFILVAGIGLVYGAVRPSLPVAGVSLLGISLWHFIYALIIWHTIHTPAPGQALLTAPNPVTDHAALSSVACLWGVQLIVIYRETGMPHLDHSKSA